MNKMYALIEVIKDLKDLKSHDFFIKVGTWTPTKVSVQDGLMY